MTTMEVKERRMQTGDSCVAFMDVKLGLPLPLQTVMRIWHQTQEITCVISTAVMNSSICGSQTFSLTWKMDRIYIYIYSISATPNNLVLLLSPSRASANALVHLMCRVSVRCTRNVRPSHIHPQDISVLMLLKNRSV